MKVNSYSLKKVIMFTLLIVIFSTSFIWGTEKITRGEIISFFKDVHIPKDTVVKGDIVSLFGDVYIHGEAEREVVAILGKVNVEGTVYRDVVSIFGGITVGPNGEVRGNATSVFGYGIINHGMIRKDKVSLLCILPNGIDPFTTLFVLILILIFLTQISSYIVSVIAILIFPDQFNKMVEEIGVNFGKKGLIGFLIYAGIFILSVIFVMTVIGIPLFLLLIPAAILLSLMGNTTAKIAIGRKICKTFHKKWTLMMELLIGTLVYILLEISLIGKLFTFGFKLVGIGEVVDSRFGNVKSSGN